MKTIIYLENNDQLNDLIASGVEEVILSPRETSRFGVMSLQEVLKLAIKLRETNLKVYLEWDILATEKPFSDLIKLLSDVDWSLFHAVRVQDPGAMEWIRENAPETKMHLILERGNHNLIGLKRWIDLYRDQTVRVCLSLELSHDKLKEAIDQLGVEVEFLALGRILLFYTPRNLLSVPYFDHEDAETKPYYQKPKEALGHSEESPHSGFPILENAHGTFMFNTRDHCLLENIIELQEMGLSAVRFDLRFGAPQELLMPLIQLTKEFSLESAQKLRELWPSKVIRGYYNANRSDRLFSKLKNSRTQARDQNFAAEVVDAIKDSHLGFLVKHSTRPVKLGESFKILTPDGKNKELKLQKMWNANGAELEVVHHGEVFFTKWTSGVSLKSMAYFESL